MYTVETDNGAGFAYYQCDCGAYAGSIEYLPEGHKYCTQCGHALFEETKVVNIQSDLLSKLADILKEVKRDERV